MTRRAGRGPLEAAPARHVFSAEIAAQVRRIELRTGRLVESLFSGEYHSVFKGRGMEFSDVREYQPGDDVRAIDWNVTARRGHPYVKEYVEERELTALIIVDLSASKAFGTGPRSNALLATEIAAVLAFAAAGNNDRAGLLLVTDRVELFVPPDSGRRHALRLVLELLSFRPAGRGTRISEALAFAKRILRRRSAIFLVSDFLVDEIDDPRFDDATRRLSRAHDLIPIRLTDPGATTLPDVGLLAVCDPETGTRRIVDTGSPVVRAEFEARELERRAGVSSLFRQLRLDVAEVSTTDDYVLPLMRLFRHRERASR